MLGNGKEDGHHRTKGERQVPYIWVDHSFPTKRSSPSPLTLFAKPWVCKTRDLQRTCHSGVPGDQQVAQKENRVLFGPRTCNHRTGKGDQEISSERSDQAAWATTRLLEQGSHGSRRRQSTRTSAPVCAHNRTALWSELESRMPSGGMADKTRRMGLDSLQRETRRVGTPYRRLKGRQYHEYVAETMEAVLVPAAFWNCWKARAPVGIGAVAGKSQRT